MAAAPPSVVNMPMGSILRVLCALLALFGAGCATHYIPNTDVEDSSDNRKIIAFCEKYRRAVEDRNVPLLLSLASPAYFEDGGNVDPTDDMDFSELRGYLEGRFRDTRAIRYEIRYRRVRPGKAGHVLVEYTYTASYKIPGLKNDEWRHSVADNRLELVPDQDSFKILSGM
jgi:hypothetical protein